MTITKADLVNEIQDQTGIHKVETRIVIDTFLTLIMEKLENGDRVELRGFGTFKLEDRAEKKARNPFNNTPVIVPKRQVPVLKFTRDFKNKIENRKVS